MKKFLKITFGFLLLLVIAVYLGTVFLLPQIVNSKFTINKIQTLVLGKTGIKANITGLNLKVSPKLVFSLNINSVDTNYDNKSVLDIKNLFLNYKLLKNYLTSINADKIYIDGNILKQFTKTSRKKSKNKFNFKRVPEINIKEITFQSDDVDVFGKNITTERDIIKLSAEIRTPYLNKTIKLGNSGMLQMAENKLIANQFKVELGDSNLFLDGMLIDKDKSLDFDLKGENLPVAELMQILLHFQKSKDPSRKFIENFKNFNGTANVNLKLNKEGIWGTSVGNNLSANAIWFDIPLFFKEAVFNFRGQTIDSVAEGILGNEKVIHTLNITDLFTPQKKLVIGTMKTTLTKKFNFVPNLTILNSVDAGLVYKIKDKKPDVYYNIDIPPNSDLIYKSFYLGLRDYKRKIYGNTLKVDNDLHVKKYKYSYWNSSNKESIILVGDGLFMKHVDKLAPDKFVPQYLTISTNGYAPTSVTGSFGEKINGGEFKGDLKYDFKNNQILGTFDVVHARHKAFHIEQAHIVSKNGIFNVTSEGFFKGEKYSAELNLKNNIYGDTLIYNMKLFLDKLVFETTQSTQTKKPKINPDEITKKVADTPITINNWEIAINEIKRDKFVLQNVKLLGSLKNNIFDFMMNDLRFADGVIHANGIYNFANNTSKMTFEADNINSNKVAQMTLNLKDQIEGIANAKVDLSARDMFKYIDAHCIFGVKEGFLPKLGDAEFAIKNSRYKLSQITNYDLAKKEEMQFDIKGAFDVNNTELKNVDITTYAPDSAMYLEGNYEMEKQYADLQLFWKFSKESPKGIRIFHIPLSLILKVVFRPEKSKEIYRSKIDKIPAIMTDEKHTNYYRVHLNGDINNNKVNLILKEIR